ncbi:MAG: 30S ribosomal protein S20 [Candidatus Vogelbacteria bacterium RIFOXYD1_FULL_46_19]|uniref:Small ribosomal subunit protein bS20 n=1 Tax=Candidatus Vogelbacteria bacterium RIFOXYD1_FULL_46_19 TaxID=1802439 RepID=A0A1G2QI60_9BACT|nr:MAG: 30S ribosomal protein S20 [Candidatus Vogelbacteria bacterium RIFOXYD1_FULL_46_19]
MPITTSAKKELRKGARKRVFNDARKKAMREQVKSVKKVLTINKDVAGAEAGLSAAYQAIDKAAKRGVIKKNTAARKKSRLAKMIKKAKAIV